MAEVNSTKVVTGKVRFSYANVFEPRAMDEGSKEKYSVVLLIPKKDKKTLDAIEKAIKAAMEAGKATKFGGKIPANAFVPLRDGDTEKPDDENYEGMMFISAKSDRRPGIVGTEMDDFGNLVALTGPEEFYSGCYGRASVNFYAFNTSGNKGVACGLQNLQKLEDGDRLSGGASAQDDFGDSEDLM